MFAAMHNVTATTRTAGGKGAVRRLRNAGQVPAVAYGKDLATISLAVLPKDILTVLKSEHGQNSVLQMKVDDDKNMLVMIKTYAYHPVTRALEHVDFVEVKLDRPVNVDIPLITTGKAAGTVQGGIVRQVYRTVPVRCLPDRIPLKIEIDITHLEMGDALHAKDLPLSEGVEVHLPPEQTVVAIVAPEKDRTEEAQAPVAGAAAAGAAAPAAAGAAPAAAGAGKAPAPAAGGKASVPPAAKDAKKK